MVSPLWTTVHVVAKPVADSGTRDVSMDSEDSVAGTITIFIIGSAYAPLTFCARHTCEVPLTGKMPAHSWVVTELEEEEPWSWPAWEPPWSWPSC